MTRRTVREVLFTGVGGQGIQIVSKALAMAAVAEGNDVLLVPRYGGGMRGGKTNAELTVGRGPLRALPVSTAAWSGFVMDQAYWETIRPNLADGALVVVNSSLFHLPVDVPDAKVFSVPAGETAAELGSRMSTGFVLLGAFVTLTGLVSVESVVDAMRQLVPAYRTQHVAANQRAIEAGAASVPALAAPAWSDLAGVR
ncbi:2-oxoacid:acceptor oxidoreductase family protein [Streptomyces sp. NPDC002896]|uniref:2-oxoacid:acceptor oxidoreductase family protein n=1 Tax=Streptomyces sp. NPDC002896 TaxID=3154438 RepID=UPI003327AF97